MTAIEEYDARVRRLMADGFTRQGAILRVAQIDPDLHRRFLRETNPEDPDVVDRVCPRQVGPPMSWMDRFSAVLNEVLANRARARRRFSEAAPNLAAAVAAGREAEDRAQAAAERCTICGVNWVDAQEGYDTCRACQNRQ